MMSTKSFPVDLQRRIEEEIVNGTLQNGELIDVRSLSKRFDTNIADIKTVLRSQVRKGLVSWINERQVQIIGLPKTEVKSVFQYAQKSKLKPRTITREVSLMPADEIMAERLCVPTGENVFMQVRTRLVDEQVLANQYNFIPYAVCPDLKDVDLSRRSFQITLEEDFHTVVTEIKETYMLGKPARDDKYILQVGGDATILIVERISYSRNKFPLVYADIHVNPDQFHYVADLWPQAVPLIDSLQR